MSKEWKQKIKKYYEGDLSEEESREIESDLEKLDIYQEIISEEIDSSNDTEKKDSPDDLPPEKITKILRNSIRNARFSLISYVIMILLLIYPAMIMSSYIYYGIGNRGQDLIQTVINTVYITEPNASLEEMDIEKRVGLFTFDVYMDLYKSIGKKDIKQGDWQVTYQFDEAKTPKRKYIIETPQRDIPYFDTKRLYHPEAELTNENINTWDTLEKLPEGTVAEVYVSLNELKQPENMKEVTKDLDVQWRWYAIDTGLEASGKNLESGYLAPIGYPAQPDPDGWSPYNSRGVNKEQFMESLYFLEKHEEQAVNISRGKFLELEYRINYLEKHGAKAYGGVVTGPTKEILKLKDNESVRSIYIGEVRLWNW